MIQVSQSQTLPVPHKVLTGQKSLPVTLDLNQAFPARRRVDVKLNSVKRVNKKARMVSQHNMLGWIGFLIGSLHVSPLFRLSPSSDGT